MVLKILLLRHYPPVECYSMESFSLKIANGLRSRGYSVDEFICPVVFGRKILKSKLVTKWLGYIDQFLIFPPLLWLRALLLPAGSLCVLSDQALGPWLPWLAGRPHVIHCHDLLALEASLGKQRFHHISTSGRMYQNWIYGGFRRGRYFISVSAATKNILEQYLTQEPELSVVLHNPLPPSLHVLPENEAELQVGSVLPELNGKSFLFHIGRNWYKNRLGVLSIWEQLHKMQFPQHLVLVGQPDEEMQHWLSKRKNLKAWLHILDAPSDQLVISLYNLASVLVFPSHAEGFGWPIVEALACGCPVVTTNRPPMSEIGGDVVTKIPPAPFPPEPLEEWAFQAACSVRKVLSRNETEKIYYRQQGIAHSYRFNMALWLDKLEDIYKGVLFRQERN